MYYIEKKIIKIIFYVKYIIIPLTIFGLKKAHTHTQK